MMTVDVGLLLLMSFRLVAGAHTLHTPMSRSWVFGRTCWGSTVCLESKPCPPPPTKTQAQEPLAAAEHRNTSDFVFIHHGWLRGLWVAVLWWTSALLLCNSHHGMLSMLSDSLQAWS
jgi:hypothetical protein